MAIVTIFDYFKQPMANVSLLFVLNQIKTGKYKQLVGSLRDFYQRDLDAEFDAQKRIIPQFSVAGNFKMMEERLELVTYSGFLLIEIPYINQRDKQTVKRLLIQDPFVSACFENTLGTGLSFVVKSSSDVSAHKELFNYAVRYYKQLTGVKQISAAGESIAHSCMVSIDEGAYIDLGAIPFSKTVGTAVF